jgi:hypothetical protein
VGPRAGLDRRKEKSLAPARNRMPTPQSSMVEVYAFWRSPLHRFHIPTAQSIGKEPMVFIIQLRVDCITSFLCGLFYDTVSTETMQYQMVGKMNWKRFGIKWLWPNLGTIPAFAWRD